MRAMPDELRSKQDMRPEDGRMSSPPKDKQKIQFSLSTLLWAMFLVATFLAALRWLGTVWVIPISLASISCANLALAIQRRSHWRRLTLGHWPVCIWSALAALATTGAVHGCLEYNKIAGTDKSPAHIVQISAVTLAGPLVGPVANPGAGEAPQARLWTAMLFAVLFLATTPFLFVRRAVSIPLALMCWFAFVGATVLWFFGAMISLGVFLS